MASSARTQAGVGEVHRLGEGFGLKRGVWSPAKAGVVKMLEIDSTLSPELTDRVKAELAQDERLVWVGQPRLDLATRPAFFLVPFGVVFAGFSLFWIVGAGLMTGGLMAPCGLP